MGEKIEARDREGEGSSDAAKRSAKASTSTSTSSHNSSGKLVFGAIGGAMSGLFPRLVTYPLETLKSRTQVQSTVTGHAVSGGATATMMQVVKNTWMRHGLWKGFFPGVHVALLGTIPGSATYFFGYELGKSVYASEAVQQAFRGTSLGSSAGLQGAFCGISAQCIANLIFTPIDIVKERMQVQATLVTTGRQSKLYTTAEMVKSIARKEGLHVFMRGYWKGNMLWMPWSTIYISTYESLKNVKSWAPSSSQAKALHSDNNANGRGGAGGAGGGTNDNDKDDEVSDTSPSPSSSYRTLHLGLCAFVASAVASISTHPIDVLKTRIQALPSEMWTHQHKGISHSQQKKLATHNTLGMLRTIWKKEGFRGLFAGLHLRVLQLSPATVMTWVIYEHLSDYFASRLN